MRTVREILDSRRPRCMEDVPAAGGYTEAIFGQLWFDSETIARLRNERAVSLGYRSKIQDMKDHLSWLGSALAVIHRIMPQGRPQAAGNVPSAR